MMRTDFFNDQMGQLLRARRGSEGDLAPKLSTILKRGFRPYGSSIFLKKCFTKNVRSTMDRGAPKDISYYEYSINKIYIDDYVGNDVFANAFCYLNAFSKIWVNRFSADCDVVLSFELSGAFGDSAALTFYDPRSSPVIDPLTIEKFEQPILLRKISR